jgi:hypothetical protein
MPRISEKFRPVYDRIAEKKCWSSDAQRKFMFWKGIAKEEPSPKKKGKKK